jgi:hypothetical protein
MFPAAVKQIGRYLPHETCVPKYRCLIERERETKVIVSVLAKAKAPPAAIRAPIVKDRCAEPPISQKKKKKEGKKNRYGRSQLHSTGQLTHSRRSDGAPEPDGALRESGHLYLFRVSCVQDVLHLL